MEDTLDAFWQIRNSDWICVWIWIFLASNSCLMISSLVVSKVVSAAYSTVLYNLRPLIVWGIFLIPWGPYLCRVQGQFHYTAVISFVMVISGVFVFKGQVTWSSIRRQVSDKYEMMETQRLSQSRSDLLDYNHGIRNNTCVLT